MSTVAVRRAFQRGVIKDARGDSRRRIEVRNVPKTALPTDIRRLCGKSRIENIAGVAVDYNRFTPTGSAWVYLTNSAFSRPAIQSINGSVLAGHEVSAHQAEDDTEDLPLRIRGVKGRAEAADRGIITGNGPSGGLLGGSSNVVLYGLPGKMSTEATGYYLKSFKLAGASPESKDIVKVDMLVNKMSLTSRFLIRLASQAEAYRMVRKLHETFYEPEIFDKRYRVRAQVIH